jgi:hypothetical protein
MHNTQANQSLEERLQPWIDRAELLIPLTIVVMAWAAGWVDLLAHESFGGTIFGRYTPAFFAVFVVYSCGFIFWFWLISSIPALDRLRGLIAFLQNRPLVFALVVLGMIAVIISMNVIDEWSTYPLVTGMVLIVMALFFLLVLLIKPAPDTPFHTWRKVVIGVLIGLIAVEALLQGLAAARVLPFSTMSGLTVPYGRIYQTEPFYVDAQTNRYGWYYPDFRLKSGEYRILLSGDTYLSGMQLPKEANMGQRLEAQLADRETPVEVLVHSHFGFGAVMYLNPLLAASMWKPLSLNEMVVVFQLGSDFENNIPEGTQPPTVGLARGVTPYVDDWNFDSWHISAHLTIRGQESPNPLRTIYSNSLLMTAFNQFVLGGKDRIQAPPLATSSATDDAPFGDATFLFDPAGEARADLAREYAAAQLRVLHDFLAEQGVQVRLVTLPYFPAQFYQTYQGTDWQTAIGEYDLLFPEQRLQAAAAENGMSFLSIGQWLQEQAVPVETIQSYFFDEGTGYLTEAGHQMMADAIFACFYSETQSDNPACVNN